MMEQKTAVDPASLIAGGARVVDLSQPMELGMPQSPNHPQFRLSMPRRHGDMVREDGGSAGNDLLVSGTHVGTHIDALGHVSHCGKLYGGADAAEAQVGGRLRTHGVEEIPPIINRAVLLDVPSVLGVDCLDGGHEITPDELDAAVEHSGTKPVPGDVILVRSGWSQKWSDPDAFVGRDSGVPGVSESGARWLAAYRPTAVGADTIAFECLRPGAGHALLPAHRILLVEEGIYIIETMALDELASLLSDRRLSDNSKADARKAGEFVLIVSPLHLVGATGSPVRPLAVL